jgi:hypothetical protein
MNPESHVSNPTQLDAPRAEDVHERMVAVFEGGHDRVAAELKLALSRLESTIVTTSIPRCGRWSFAHAFPNALTICATAAPEEPTAYTIRAMRRKSWQAIAIRI